MHTFDNIYSQNILSMQYNKIDFGAYIFRYIYCEKAEGGEGALRMNISAVRRGIWLHQLVPMVFVVFSGWFWWFMYKVLVGGGVRKFCI